jgi:peptidoglycan/xylan/chitin deacetylase (PgdA/CDA1 family)
LGTLSLISTATFKNLSLVVLITPVLVSHNQSTTQDFTIAHSASAYSSAIVNVSAVPTRLAIINFDDGYKSQFTNAKPILDMYGFKATFFIICNFVGKSAEQMNSSSIVNFAGKGVQQMTWNDIVKLYKQGYQIGAHTMDHLRNMTSMTKSELDYEIGRSKQCILDHGIPVTTFAYPFDNGKDNATIVNKVSEYFSYARSGDYPLMFLHCDHFKENTQQHDCRTYLSNGKISFGNKYSIIGWSHDYDRIAHFYNDDQMFNRFIQVVGGQEKYNRPGYPVDAIPIVVYHRIDNSRAPYSTTVYLFTEEMKYLHDNGFRVINMADLVYNNSTNSFSIKKQLGHTECTFGLLASKR